MEHDILRTRLILCDYLGKKQEKARTAFMTTPDWAVEAYAQEWEDVLLNDKDPYTHIRSELDNDPMQALFNVTF